MMSVWAKQGLNITIVNVILCFGTGWCCHYIPVQGNTSHFALVITGFQYKFCGHNLRRKPQW